jgi:hypothetical protein
MCDGSNPWSDDLCPGLTLLGQLHYVTEMIAVIIIISNNNDKPKRVCR